MCNTSITKKESYQMKRLPKSRLTATQRHIEETAALKYSDTLHQTQCVEHADIAAMDYLNGIMVEQMNEPHVAEFCKSLLSGYMEQQRDEVFGIPSLIPVLYTDDHDQEPDPVYLASEDGELN